MRTRSSLLAIGCLLSAVSAQWLETTVALTDSAGGIISPKAIAYDSVNDRVYVCGDIGNCVIVIDGATNQKLDRIAVPSGGSDVLWNPATGKLYHADSYNNSVTVIDCASNQVLRTIPVGSSPREFCLVPGSNKLYCSCGNGQVAVIDGTQDSLLGLIEVEPLDWSLCHNPRNGRIYSANSFGGTVSVIDCATDTVIATVPVGEGPEDVCYAGSNNSVYCGYGSLAQNDTVAVIDGNSSAIVAKIVVGSLPFALCYVARENAVYCANMCDSTVTVIDCSTNQVTATIPVGMGSSALCLDPAHNKVYCGNYDADDVSVIDCATNQVVQRLPAGDAPGAFALNPTWNRVYVANDRDSTVTVYRDTSAPGVADARSVSGTVSGGPSIVRGVLTLPASGATTHALLDRAGRVVMSLCPGANDVSHLAPGVYYLSEHPTSKGGRPALTPFRKLVVTR